MPEINQTTFLGATVTQFNCNLGWNKEATTVSIGLVEDESNGDSFVNPGIFSVNLFQIESFSYWGVLTNIEQTKGRDGNPLLNVTLTDPRQFLSGVHLILDGYNGGVFGVPNLYNIYGYLESISYGYSGRVSSGIPYAKIREGLLALINNFPVTYRGVNYTVDLSGLPNISPNYYFSSPDMTLLDFIDEVSEVGNFDYICELDGNVIRFISVDRNQQFLSGSIKNYIDSKQGYSSSSISLQGEYNTINKFILGSPVEEVFFQYFNNNQDPEAVIDNMISDYWGLDRFGNVIVNNGGVEYNNTYGETFSVTVEGFSITDERFLTNPVSGGLNGPVHDNKVRDFTNGYTFDLGELRAASVSREAWESYVIFHDYVVPDDNPNNIKRSVHEGKTKKIQLAGEVPNSNTFDIFFTDRPLANFNPAEVTALKEAAAVDPFFEKEDYIQRVYDFVKNYADSYFGVKVMVKIPFVLSKYNEFNQIETSYEPVDSGYIEESLFASAIQNNLLPYNIDIVKNSDNKIEAFVRFDPTEIIFNADGTFSNDDLGLNISEIPSDLYYIGNTRVVDDRDGNPDTNIYLQSIFIKCTVDPEVVFINKSTGFDPRVIINLPGKVLVNDRNSGPEFTLRNIFAKRGLNQVQIDDQVKRFKSKVGSDSLILGGQKMPALPNMSAIPLRNNLLRYGPWYTQNGQGKVEFIKDDDLSPWNFGGFVNMNNAGSSLVSNMSEARFFGEGGTIEFAGVPDIKLGRQISLNGPIITNMSTSVDSGGIVTRYTLNRWDQKSGRNNKYFVDQFKKLNDNNKEIAKARKELFKPQKPNINTNSLKLKERKEFPRRRVSNSSSQMVCSDISSSSNYTFVSGQEVPFSGDEKYQVNAAVMPFYTTLDNLRNDNWNKKGGVSLDGLYRPFTLKVGSSGIPSFETPIGSSGPDSVSLNPFKAGHDIQVVFHGEEVPENLSRESYTGADYIEDYRPVALRGPLVLAGWGYDTEGKPVPGKIDDPLNSGILPSGSSDSVFMDNYLQRSDQWKVGPVDLRWDRERKVWASNVGEKVIVKNESTIAGYLTTTSGFGLDATSETEVFSGGCAEYDIIDGILKPTSNGGTLHNVNQAILPKDSFCVALKKSVNEYIYCEGGKVPFSTITSVFVSGVDLYATRRQFYGYQYSGVDTVSLLIEGSGCG